MMYPIYIDTPKTQLSLIAEVRFVVASNKTASHKGKKKAAERMKPATTAKHAVHPTAAVTVDRRGKAERRQAADRRLKLEPVNVERRVIERRVKVIRRRQIDPTTCERDYSAEEIEFMNALDNYKRTSGRMFPTCSEVLEVIRSLGYDKCPKPQPESESEQQPEQHDVPKALPNPMPSIEMLHVGIADTATVY